jgi:hypothetical protein
MFQAGLELFPPQRFRAGIRSPVGICNPSVNDFAMQRVAVLSERELGEVYGSFYRCIVRSRGRRELRGVFGQHSADLLEGIFQLADVCQESLNERDDASQYENLKTSLSLVRLFANDALKHGNLAEGFRLAAECFAPATAVPQEIL